MDKYTEKLKKEFARLRPLVLKPASGFLKHDYTVPGGEKANVGGCG